MPIFVVQKAAAPKIGVEFRQGSNGTVRSSLASITTKVEYSNNFVYFLTTHIPPEIVLKLGFIITTDLERLFSVAGQIATDKRACLLPDNLEKILFLRENILY